MADIEEWLNRWQSAGVLEAGAADRIRAYESEQKRPSGLHWQGIAALILGALMLACGVVLFVSARWDDIGPGARYAIVMAMVAVFHIGGSYARERFRALSTTLHAVGTIATGAAIALVGQIFNIQEHWPAAFLLWAVAALAGWILLHDELQQSLTLLLFPAWLLSELVFHADRHIGESAYVGRFLVVWAILYLTLFLGSKRKVAQGILFTAGAIAAVVGAGFLLEGWLSGPGEQTFLPFATRFWGWAAIAALPLFIAIFRLRKAIVPVTLALVFSLILPWAHRAWNQHYDYGHGVQGFYVRDRPNLLAHVLVAAFAVFIIWWGVRMASRALVNLGILYFAIAIGWFYFSDIYDKAGRSLGLIGMGILFLAGGWILEKTRRRLLARMAQSGVPVEVAS